MASVEVTQIHLLANCAFVHCVISSCSLVSSIQNLVETKTFVTEYYYFCVSLFIFVGCIHSRSTNQNLFDVFLCAIYKVTQCMWVSNTEVYCNNIYNDILLIINTQINFFFPVPPFLGVFRFDHK